jgi:hypothetical protein
MPNIMAGLVGCMAGLVGCAVIVKCRAPALGSERDNFY